MDGRQSNVDIWINDWALNENLFTLVSRSKLFQCANDSQAHRIVRSSSKHLLSSYSPPPPILSKNNTTHIYPTLTAPTLRAWNGNLKN